MNAETHSPGMRSQHLVIVHPEPPGQYTAQVMGLPQVRATAASEQEAIDQVRHLLAEWLATGRWVWVEAGMPTLPPLPPAGGPFKDPSDPLEQEYLQELARNRQEDLERTIREYDQPCSSSSSTPTT